ncbi:putative ribonuclease H-like domain-containing protein [Tanacetum coccineum]|uniref:Ribonuclease H-like domain-containing protein n=1 Tax=Tanacetum coccineum TaxID=301880 RepID=A0ABQ4ZY05_9ASTR
MMKHQTMKINLDPSAALTTTTVHAVEKERKARTILLHGLFHKEQLRRFQGMDDQKEILGSPSELVLVVIANVKKMQKLFSSYISFEHLQDPVLRVRKGNMNRFSQVTFSVGRTHGVQVSTKDANYKFSSGLCPQPGLIWQCYEELKTQMLILYPIDGGLASEEPGSKIDDLDIEEMDINWSDSNDELLRKKKFYKKLEGGFRVAGKTPVWFLTKKKLEFFNCTQHWHFARNGEHTEDEETNHALMAISSSSELSQAVKKLETQLATFQKQQLSLNEKLTFQANEIYEKDEKLKKYKRIGMKAVKEKEQLQKTLDSWKDSSKNLWRLINYGMSSSSKIGLGYEIKSNNEVLSYEEEMNFSIFNCIEEDSVGKPLYSRFIKTNDFKGVPHPLSGDYTPKPQEEIDESLYVYGKKGPQEPEPSVSDDRSSEYSTCQSNDSAGSIGTSSEHSVDLESEISRVPQEVYVSKPITTNEKGVSAPKSKEVEPSCVSHIKTPRQPIKDQETPKVNRKNWNAMMERELGEGYSFTKKKCFVCGSLSHLIKDYDYYEKKMAREAAPKKQRVFNTVQLNAGRAKINSIRPNINTGRTNINYVRPRVNTVNTVRSRQSVPTRTSNSFSPKRPQDLCSLEDMIDRGIFDSGCSGHMTGNKDQLEDFEEFNGGSVTFGGSKGYITGKGRIRVAQGSFIETECLVVSSDFKMPDENQILLKVPRHHNMYSFDMRTPTPAKSFACLIAKATSDESRMWHRRLKTSLIIGLKSLDQIMALNLRIEICLNFVKQGNKTEYSNARTPLRMGGCERIEQDPNYTLSVLGKFDGKSDEGFLVGYSLNSKAYRVYNLVTKRVEVNLHVNFLEDKPNVKGVGYRWMFDIDYLTDSMNYIPVSLENQANPHAGTSEVTNSAGTSQTPNAIASEEKDEDAELIVVPSAVKNTEEKVESRTSSTNSKKEEILIEPQQEKKASSTDTSEDDPKILAFSRELEEIALKHLGTVSENNYTSTPSVNTGSESVNTGRLDPDDSPMLELEIFHKSETGIFDEASYDEEGVITDFNSLPTKIEVSPIPTLRIHNIHPKSQILGDPKSAVQTRSKVQQKSGAHALFSYIQKQQRNNHKDQ